MYCCTEHLYSRVQHQTQALPRTQLVDIIPRLYQRNQGCTIKCWKTVWWVSDDPETRCAVWQSLAPPHSDTLRTNQRRTRSLNESFATFPDDSWAFQLATYFNLRTLHRRSRAHKIPQKYISSSFRILYDARGPSISSPHNG